LYAWESKGTTERLNKLIFRDRRGWTIKCYITKLMNWWDYKNACKICPLQFTVICNSLSIWIQGNELSLFLVNSSTSFSEELDDGKRGNWKMICFCNGAKMNKKRVHDTVRFKVSLIVYVLGLTISTLFTILELSLSSPYKFLCQHDRTSRIYKFELLLSIANLIRHSLISTCDAQMVYFVCQCIPVPLSVPCTLNYKLTSKSITHYMSINEESDAFASK